MACSDSSVPLVAGGQSLLKTKNEDQGFEIIKEVPASMPRMGNPFFGGTSGLLSANPNLGPLAALIGGGSMSNMSNMSSLLSGAGAAGGMGGLMSQSNMLQKCKLLEYLEK